jgi:hypothetical protein
MNDIRIVRTGKGPRSVAIGSIEKFPCIFEHQGQMFFMNRQFTKPSQIIGKRLMSTPQGYSFATGEIIEFKELELVNLYEAGAIVLVL